MYPRAFVNCFTAGRKHEMLEHIDAVEQVTAIINLTGDESPSTSLQLQTAKGHASSRRNCSQETS